MKLLKIARRPPVTVGPKTSVHDAVRVMDRDGAGAVVVVEDGVPVGIFTGRDLVRRVLARGLPLEATPMERVMTAPPLVARADTGCREALSLMLQNHCRHLPIVDAEGRLAGMLSTRHLLRCMVDDLSQELQALQSYICADGIGG